MRTDWGGMAEAFVIWGGFGGHNFGDEAILWAASRLLRKLRPKSKQFVIVLHDISDNTAELYREWELDVVRAGSLDCLRALLIARLVVGGGQLVDDKTIGWPVGWTSLFLVANRIFGQRPLMLCIGAEAIKRRLTVRLVRHFYSLASVCTCRDAETAAILRKAGVPSARIWVARDMVFSLDRTVLPAHCAIKSSGYQIAVLIAKDADRLPDIIERLHLLITSLLRCGFQVRLLAHDVRDSYDRGALLLFKERYANEPRVITSRADTLKDILDLYSQCDAVISARMHPLILASLVGALPIAIVLTGKVKALAANLGIPILAFDSDPQVQAAQISQLVAQREEYTKPLEERSKEWGKTVEQVTGDALSR
jgi:polysaccharide pyruvyl transferase WcaK-like protein